MNKQKKHWTMFQVCEFDDASQEYVSKVYIRYIHPSVDEALPFLRRSKGEFKVEGCGEVLHAAQQVVVFYPQHHIPMSILEWSLYLNKQVTFVRAL